MSYWYASPFGNDSNDGTSFAKAKRTIQAAINAAAPGETVRVWQGIYREALTINKPLEVLVYAPSKKWGMARLIGAGSGVGATLTGLSGTQSVRFIGFRMEGWASAIGGTNSGGTLTAMGVFCSPSVGYGIAVAGLQRVRAWSCVFEEQTSAIGGANALEAEQIEARGCTFFNCGKCLTIGDHGVLARWRNCIMHNAGSAQRYVEMDQVVAFEADYNLYGGAMPSSGYFLAGGISYNSNGMFDGQWKAFQDIHSPTRNLDPRFIKASLPG
jgi:hypothetical protein